MDFNSLIKDPINEAVQDAIADILPTAISQVLAEVNKPEYNNWGRFLTTEQACTYLGIKSINGLKTFTNKKGIKALGSGKSTRYDRHELDKINTTAAVENYCNNLKSKEKW